MIKKLLSTILLFLFLWNSCGFFINYYVKIQDAKNQYHLHNKLICTVHLKYSDLSKSKIIWTKKNKEFKWNNNMFDIKKTYVKKGCKYLVCINDTHEKELDAGFFNHIGKTKNKKEKTKNQQRLFLPLAEVIETPNSIIYFDKIEYFYMDKKYQFYQNSVEIPPNFNLFYC